MCSHKNKQFKQDCRVPNHNLNLFILLQSSAYAILTTNRKFLFEVVLHRLHNVSTTFHSVFIRTHIATQTTNISRKYTRMIGFL